MDMLTRNLKAYCEAGILESCQRNIHMHEATLAELQAAPRVVVEAVLVDFLNFVAANQVMDLALYAKDLH